MLLRRIGLTAAVAVLAASPAAAGEPRALPAFRVLALDDGRSVTGPSLSGHERWVLVYVVPDCRPCDRLVRALKRWRTPALTERTVLVIGALPDDSAAWLRGALPRELRALPRFADADGEAWQALGLEGAPVVLGVQRGRVEWSVSGQLGEPATLESILRTWVGR